MDVKKNSYFYFQKKKITPNQIFKKQGGKYFSSFGGKKAAGSGWRYFPLKKSLSSNIQTENTSTLPTAEIHSFSVNICSVRFYLFIVSCIAYLQGLWFRCSIFYFLRYGAIKFVTCKIITLGFSKESP